MSAVERDCYAVIGHPIEHSLSPLIHRYFAEICGQSLTYDLLPSPEEEFETTVQAFFDGGGRGLNVTLPFKERAERFVAQSDAAAALAGAVNTIRRNESGSLEGFNTDGVGLLRDLEDNLGWPLADASVLVIGAGGASRGALDALLRAQPESITLTNRTLQRAQALVADVAPADPRVNICAPAELNRPYDVVINATSASLSGQGALVPTEAVAGAKCYDMLYSPRQTVFAGWALSHGATEVADGLGMLLEQAAEAFLLWRGVRPDTRELLEQRQALFAAKQANAFSVSQFLANQTESTDSSGSGIDSNSSSVAANLEAAAQPSASAKLPKRRFIAGAVCPKCREIDRIFVRETQTGREQACVACGYVQPEEGSADSGAHGSVPRGKHERQPVTNPAALESQPVRFIDPSADSAAGSNKNDKKTD